MSNTNDRFEKSVSSSLHAKAGQNAALRGALLAFAKPPLNPQHTHTPSSKSSGVLSSTSTARKVRPGAARSHLRPNTPSQNYIQQDRAQSYFTTPPTPTYDDGKSTYLTYGDTRLDHSGFLAPSIDEQSRSKSPSRIAAGLAALRHSPQSTERPPSAVRTDAWHWTSNGDDGSRLRVSPQHTASQVRQWLDHMDGTSSEPTTNAQQPLRRAATGPSTYSNAYGLGSSTQFTYSPPRTDEQTQIGTAVIHHDEGLTSKHVSQMPLHVSSMAVSLESGALMSSSELSTSDAHSESGREARHRATSYMQEPSNVSGLNTEDTSSEISDYEVTGTADEEEDLDDLTLYAESIASEAPETYTVSEARSYSGMTSRPIPIPTLKTRPPPSLRPVIDARQKLDNAKRGVQAVAPGWKPSPAHHVDSLASAMIASSLAASRAPSPAKSPAPPLIRRHTDHPHLQMSHLRLGRRRTRSPSPPRAMPHTLRKAKSSSDEDEKEKGRIQRVKRGLHINKHPHKHHEGDRKRWRDEITPRECKRYEGLWAANRGLLIELEPGTTFDPLNSHVSNIVVRDIWTRSRLPLQALEEVWDLVDREGIGKLTKEEFVVGMWLVDQRLKGRKLPAKVGQSVWRSARGLYGLKVRKIKD